MTDTVHRPGDVVRIPVGKVRTPNGYFRTRCATVIDQRGRFVRVRPSGQRPTVVDVDDIAFAAKEHELRLRRGA
jgi:hypothetical protein